MPLFRKKHGDNASDGQPSSLLSRRHIMPATLMLAAGMAVSAVISDIPVGVKQAFTFSADASYEERLYRDFSPADVDILKEHADAPVHEFALLTGQLADIGSAVGKTAYDPLAMRGKAEETTAVPETTSAPAAETTTVPVTEPTTVPVAEPATEAVAPTVDADLFVDRSNEPVASGNKNLYKSNYRYGASSLAHEGGAGLNTSGIPMSELKLPDSLQFDENGAPLHYSYYMDCYATAYSSGNITSTGTGVYQGCVAVDPREIPYGTEMWIVSLDGKYVYGYCRAEDTGGFIYYTNGATVDLYMYSETDCVNWGFRGVRVYVLPSSY